MRNIFIYKRAWLLLLLPVSLLAVAWAGAYPHAVEHYYSASFYVAVSTIGARITGALPFSLAECILAAAAIAVPGYLVFQIRGILQKRKPLAALLATLCMAAGVLPAAFTFSCGLNYYRPSFASRIGLEVRPSSAQELALLLQELIQSANTVRAGLPEGADGVMLSAFENPRDTAAAAARAFSLLGAEHAVLSGYVPHPKTVYLSRIMSYLDLVGFYFPLTFEANVNAAIPAVDIPSGMVHELAHYKGIMQEQEANYIAWLGCRASGNAELEYSGTILAYIHTANALYAADSALYWQLAESLSPAVRRDLAARSAYWARHAGAAAELSAAVNDSYLKFNNQSSGVASYGAMVDLLLAEYRLRHP